MFLQTLSITSLELPSILLAIGEVKHKGKKNKQIKDGDA